MAMSRQPRLPRNHKRSPLPGGRPTNSASYPEDKTFNAQAFRLELSRQELSIRAFISLVRTKTGLRLYSSTVWRWTQHGLYPEASCPPIRTLRIVETVLGVPLLKDKP